MLDHDVISSIFAIISGFISALLLIKLKGGKKIVNRENDLGINVLKGKKHSNVRSSGADEAVVLVPHQQMSLEEMMAYIDEDELLEITPSKLRLRKKYLDPNERKKMSKT